MSQEQWTLVDRYITDALVPNEPALEAALAASDAAGLPSIHVSPNEKLKKLAHVSATTIQTVGSKGYDGFTLAVVG